MGVLLLRLLTIAIILFVRLVDAQSRTQNLRLLFFGWEWTHEAIVFYGLNAASGAIAMTLYRILFAREITARHSGAGSYY